MALEACSPRSTVPGGRSTGRSARSERSRAAAALVVALGLVVVLTVAAASGQPAEGGSISRPLVTAVDGSGGRVVASILTPDLDPRSVVVRENGTEVTASRSTAQDRGAGTEVMFVVDVDNSNVADGTLAAYISALDDVVSRLPDSVRVGVVLAGAEADIVSRLTTDRDRPIEALQAGSADIGSALYDATFLATESFGDNPGTIRTVVVLAGGTDTASTSGLRAVEAALVQKGAQLVTVTTGATDRGLARLVGAAGGASLTTAGAAEAADGGTDLIDSAALVAQVETAARMGTDRLLLTYDSPDGTVARPNVEVRLGDDVLRYSYPAGVLTTSRLQLQPSEVEAAGGPGLLGSDPVLYGSVALAFLAITAGLWSLASTFAPGESSLDQVLASYSDQDTNLDESEVQEMLVQTALIQRAVTLTENFAERRGFLTRIEEMLERANLPIRPGEALFFVAIGIVAVFAASATATGSLVAAAILALVAAGGSYLGLQLAARRRLKAFEAQLPDALQLLSGTLRAGYSLPQGIDAVSTEIADPMGHELRRAVTEAQLGRELEDALANIAERLDSPDFAWAVMAIGIQREVGGNLAEVLLTVAETMIQRERLKREVNALTAEGRVSAFILAMMPPGLGLVMYVMNPSYVGVLFSRTIGLVLIGLAVTSGLIGLVWMKKVITIDA